MGAVVRTTYRPTWAEIDLAALKHNVKAMRRFLFRVTDMLVVVKANAYGHGMIEVTKTLEECGVRYFGVATMDEAMTLRAHGIVSPLLVLGALFEHEVEVALTNSITMTLCNRELLENIAAKAAALKVTAKVHVKIDTGMGRIGIWHADAVPFIEEAAKTPYLLIEGAYTHFSSAGRDKFYTEYQLESLEKVSDQLRQLGITIPYWHAANSVAAVGCRQSHLNLIRPGIVIYGMYPKKGAEQHIKLLPVMTLKTRICFLKKVPAGRSISYGRTYMTQKDTVIATIPIGYADGYGRILSNKAQVLVRGARAPVVGKITMDQTMLDVGHIKDVALGDEVVLIGTQGFEHITAEELAKLCGTIPYEIVTGITERVPRIYKR